MAKNIWRFSAINALLQIGSYSNILHLGSRDILFARRSGRLNHGHRRHFYRFAHRIKMQPCIDRRRQGRFMAERLPDDDGATAMIACQLSLIAKLLERRLDLTFKSCMAASSSIQRSFPRHAFRRGARRLVPPAHRRRLLQGK